MINWIFGLFHDVRHRCTMFTPPEGSDHGKVFMHGWRKLRTFYVTPAGTSYEIPVRTGHEVYEVIATSGWMEAVTMIRKLQEEESSGGRNDRMDQAEAE